MVNRRRSSRIGALSLVSAAVLLASSSACSTEEAAPTAADTPASGSSSPSSAPSADSSEDPSEDSSEDSPSDSPSASEPTTPSASDDAASAEPSGEGPPTAADQRRRGKGSGDYDLVLTDVRVGAHDGYDRVVMEFRGTGTPGWRVRYVKNPRLEGSGTRVRLGGDSALSVVADRTTYPGEGEGYYDGPARLTGPGDPVTDVYVGGTFEGYTAAYVGVDGSKPPFRVFRLTDPVRLVVDVSAGS